MNLVKTSEAARDFAELFLKDEREDAEEKERKIAAAEKRNELIRRVENDEICVKTNGDFTSSYDKWAQYEKELRDAEEAEEENRREAQADAQRMMPGCAHDHTKERLIFEKSTMEKIKAADRFRLEGNVAFKSGNYGLAAVYYRKALLQFDYTFPDTDEENHRFNEVKLPCHLNLAACKLRQKDWEEVLTQCRLAIELDERSCKAYYRRGVVYLHLDHFEEAKEAFDKALHLEPENRDVLQALDTLRKKRKKYRIRSKEVYAAMLRDNEGSIVRQQSTTNEKLDVEDEGDSMVTAESPPSSDVKGTAPRMESNSIEESQRTESKSLECVELQGNSRNTFKFGLDEARECTDEEHLPRNGIAELRSDGILQERCVLCPSDSQREQKQNDKRIEQNNEVDMHEFNKSSAETTIIPIAPKGVSLCRIVTVSFFVLLFSIVFKLGSISLNSENTVERVVVIVVLGIMSLFLLLTVCLFWSVRHRQSP